MDPEREFAAGNLDGIQNRPSGAKLSKSPMIVSAGGGFFSRPAFPETTVMTVPFGPSDFEKVILVDGDWFIFCFSVCYLLYNLFIALFHYTTVNVGPLSLPICEKLAPHFKIENVLIWVLCVCVFYFFISVLIFGYRLRPPGAGWSLFGSMLVSLLVDYPKPESPKPQVFKKAASAELPEG